MKRAILRLTAEEFGRSSLNLGRADENIAVRVEIDLSRILAQEPTAKAHINVQNPSGTEYAAATSMDGTKLIWDVTKADNTIEGTGCAQLTVKGPNGEVLKSAVAATRIGHSIRGEGPAPDPMQNWVDDATNKLGSVVQAGEDAEAAAAKANAAAKAANESAQKAEDAAEEATAAGKNAVRYDVQNLTEAQQKQARKNLSLDILDIKDVETADFTDLVKEFGMTSGQELTAKGATIASNSYVTGYIPIKKGDVIRIKDPAAVTANVVYAIYDQSKTIGDSVIGRYVQDITSGTAYGAMTVNGDTLTWDTSTIYYWFWRDAAYMRLTLTTADAIVTKNEEIVYSTKHTVTIREDILPSVKQLTGKRAVVLGDSIIGMTRDSTSVTAYAADYGGASVLNAGFGGCRMSVHPSNGYAAFSAWALAEAIATGVWTTQEEQAGAGQDYFAAQLDGLKAVDFAKVDMLVIHYGTNDFAAGVELDDSANDTNTSTVCGALRYTLRKLMAAYPKMRVYVSLPLYRIWDTAGAETYKNAKGKTLPEYNAAIEAVAYAFNCPVINGYKALGINSINGSAYLSDGTHLTNHGRESFGSLMGGSLCIPAAGRDNA